MPVNKEDVALLFIMSLPLEMTLLAYENKTVVIVDLPIHWYFKTQQAIQEKGYLAPLWVRNECFYPVRGSRNPCTSWINIECLCKKDIMKQYTFLLQYEPYLSWKQVLRMIEKAYGKKKEEKK